MRTCVPACLSPRGSILYFLNKNISVTPEGLSVCLSVIFDLPCPGLPQQTFPLCLKYDLLRNLLSVDQAFCESLYLCDSKNVTIWPRCFQDTGFQESRENSRVSEYDQELPQSYTADQTTTPRGRATDY